MQSLEPSHLWRTGIGSVESRSDMPVLFGSGCSGMGASSCSPGVLLPLHAHAALCCSRYDYEEVDSAAAEAVMSQVRKVIADSPKGTKFGDFTLDVADDFEYKDPIDGSIASKQGLRFVFTGEYGLL